MHCVGKRLGKRLGKRYRGVLLSGLAALFLGLVATPTKAEAVLVDVSTLFSNIGFENGNLSGWTLTRPNSSFVSSLTPPVNPTINPADPANDPTTLTAPAGAFFTGLKNPGDGVDLKYKLAHNAIPISASPDAVFQVAVFANRGRLEPFDSPGSTADVLVRIFGWTTNSSTPTVNASTDDWSRTVNWNPAAQSFDFTGVADGTWAQQIFTFDPAASGINPADLKYLSISISGRNNNHDQYIATDIGQVPVIPEPMSFSLFGLGLAGLSFRRRFWF